MTTDFRALCAELLAHAERAQSVAAQDLWFGDEDDGLFDRARAAMAEAAPKSGKPASVAKEPRPTDQQLKTFACEWWHKFGFVKNKATCTWVIDEIAPEHFVDFMRSVLARWGNPAPQPPADVSQPSDGYHTFAELYEHRHSLMLALMRAQPHICWFSRRHADGELPFGSDDWFIVGAELPDAPITYHLPAALYSLAQKTGAIELLVGRPWDGHTAADVVQRLRDWAITPPPPADGEVAKLVTWLRHEAESQHPGSGEALPSDMRDELLNASTLLTRAADLLQRLSPPQPVPVSERLPAPKDCDAEGRCWVWWKNGVRWVLDEWTHHELREGPLSDYVSHWLPAHAIPIPTAND